MRKAAIAHLASFTAIIALSALAGGRAQAEDIAGTYKCQPDPTPCHWSGSTPSITQSGNKLEIKNEKGDIANATLTSDITISAGGPLNSYGVIRPDNTIDWSDGTKWHKQ